MLVLIRHGESQWNLENKFTGEVDIDLTKHGIEEAKEAGAKLKGYTFDRAFCSELKRAKHTLQIVLEEIGAPKSLPIACDRALNERNYGDLQGLNKTETAKRFGEDQVHIWRRSYDVRPPGGESLKDTAARVIPYYEHQIKPYVDKGEHVLVVAHGNSLRALLMVLEGLSPEKITEINIPTGVPRVYEFNADGSVKSADYL
ncbi:2,3-bisphosphoglycerate-dependent phosphoglycerate mutase [Olivibacter sitiensis]|uniref:2,3-bisphosphoglycerate-dependent phosphoglycerate mutase n=1 Tax=Olivibacter sitiensis TaxID=376470 RepID=UPI000401ADFC|nr:2,3-bisphosphoglycerate-dependent phosphoglycerate mutase [Olivibacter sitiensis]